MEYKSKDFKLMVKRVFITSDIGEEGLPKWASWVKVVVDGMTASNPFSFLCDRPIFSAEDLSLNVSRESLQSNRFLKQLRQIILKRIIHLFTKISEGDDQEKIDKMQKTYGSVLKLGAVEDAKNRDKLAGLTRYVTNQRSNTSFDQVGYSLQIFLIYSSADCSFQVLEKQKKGTEAGSQINITISAGIDSALSRSST